MPFLPCGEPKLHLSHAVCVVQFAVSFKRRGVEERASSRGVGRTSEGEKADWSSGGMHALRGGEGSEARQAEGKLQEGDERGKRALSEHTCEREAEHAKGIGGEEEVPPSAASEHQRQPSSYKQQHQQPLHVSSSEPLSREAVFSVVAKAVREAVKGEPVEVDLTNPDVSECGSKGVRE